MVLKSQLPQRASVAHIWSPLLPRQPPTSSCISYCTFTVERDGRRRHELTKMRGHTEMMLLPFPRLLWSLLSGADSSSLTTPTPLAYLSTTQFPVSLESTSTWALKSRLEVWKGGKNL